MPKTPKKSTAETVAASAAEVMRKGRSRKSAKEPEMEEGEEDPGESESDSSDEDWGTITAFKYKKVLRKLGPLIGWNDEDDYLVVLDHLQGMKDYVERHMNSEGNESNLWELCMSTYFGDSIKGVGKADPDVLEQAETLLFEEASTAKLGLLKEFAETAQSGPWVPTPNRIA
jgi:hypothetical protein